jgi:hypothetical protein
VKRRIRGLKEQEHSSGGSLPVVFKHRFDLNDEGFLVMPRTNAFVVPFFPDLVAAFPSVAALREQSSNP